MSTGTSGITLGPRIKWAMERAGKSVDDLAAHFEVHEVSVYRWLRDDPRVNLERLEQIAEYLGRPVWWFFAPEEVVKEKPPHRNGMEAKISEAALTEGGVSVESPSGEEESAHLHPGFAIRGGGRDQLVIDLVVRGRKDRAVIIDVGAREENPDG